MTENPHTPDDDPTEPTTHPLTAQVGLALSAVTTRAALVKDMFGERSITSTVTLTFADGTTHSFCEDEADVFVLGTVTASSHCEDCDQPIHLITDSDEPGGLWVTSDGATHCDAA